jgi:hypothetical protein
MYVLYFGSGNVFESVYLYQFPVENPNLKGKPEGTEGKIIERG